MTDEFSSTEIIIEETIRRIANAADDEQKRWDITLETADLLYFWGDTSIDGLIKLLSKNDRKVLTISMMYLGMLHDMGLNAKRAIEPIQQVCAPYDSGIIIIAYGIALALLGQREAVQARDKFMKSAKIPNVREWRRGGIATIVQFIATGSRIF